MSHLLYNLITGLQTTLNIDYDTIPIGFLTALLGKRNFVTNNRDIGIPTLLEDIDRHVISINDAGDNDYDFIVIGGGAAGCAISRTLSDDHNLLLIERGSSRSSDVASYARYIDQAGLVISNPMISQPVVTSSGVISHIPNVLGGGTSINMGIAIEETEDYFKYLAANYDLDLDYTEMSEAIDWVQSYSVTPMPQDTVYSLGLRLFAEDKYGHNRGPQSQLELNSSWQGDTFFDAGGNFERMAADVLLSDANQDNFDLLLNTNVTSVTFQDDTARCVLVQDFSEKYPNSIISTASSWIGALKASILKTPIGLYLSKYNPNWLKRIFPTIISNEQSIFNPNDVDTYKICVKPGGKIILSAGTLMSPMILANSGIGTTDSLNATKAEPKVINETIGRSILDRAFVPIGLFMNDDNDFDEDKQCSVPRIVESLGLTVDGDEMCEVLSKIDPFGQSFRAPDAPCTMQALESLGGAAIGQGVIHSTLFFVPPPLRQNPLVVEFMDILRNCEYDIAPFGLDFARNLICPELKQTIKCLKRIRAVFYFQAQPLSTFDIGLFEEPQGERTMTYGTGFGNVSMRVDGDYLTTQAEADAAMGGVKRIIDGINEGYFDEASQDSGAESCPKDMIIGVVGGLTRVYEALTIAFALLKTKQNFYTAITDSFAQVTTDKITIDEHEIYGQYQRLQKTFESWAPLLNDQFDTDVSMISQKIKENFLDDPPLDVNGEPTDDLNKIYQLPKHISEFYADGSKVHVGQFGAALESSDSYLHRNQIHVDASESGRLFTLDDLPKSFIRRLRETDTDSKRLLHRAIDTFFNLYKIEDSDEANSVTKRRLQESTPDWLSYWDIDSDESKSSESFTQNPNVTTFPPVLPQSHDPRQLFNYVQTYKTSIWHWIGSLKASSNQSDPIDANFAVRGIENLHVVDASVLPLMPRMNPVLTLIGLGRYAAKKVLH